MILQLALGILTTLFGGIYYATSGPSKKTASGPAFNASSKDEENFIQYGTSSILDGQTRNK